MNSIIFTQRKGRRVDGDFIIDMHLASLQSVEASKLAEWEELFFLIPKKLHSNFLR